MLERSVEILKRVAMGGHCEVDMKMKEQSM